MEQEAVPAAWRFKAAATAGTSAAGHKFTLERHFDADGPTC